MPAHVFCILRIDLEFHMVNVHMIIVVSKISAQFTSIGGDSDMKSSRMDISFGFDVHRLTADFYAIRRRRWLNDR